LLIRALESFVYSVSLVVFSVESILAFYEKPVLAMTATVVIVAVCFFLLYRYKKPWIYYYAAAATVIAAIAYAWPEA